MNHATPSNRRFLPFLPFLPFQQFQPFLPLRQAARTLTAGLVLPALMLLVTGVAAQAAGLSQSEETRLSVEYEGERHFLIRKLSGAEIRELVSDNTLIFIHPRGEEEEYHFSNGQTLNSWSQDDTANAGLWQIEEDEICWTYPGGTHCKPIWTTEREDLYAQVPGWYDGPLAFIWEPGDSRRLQDREELGNAI